MMFKKLGILATACLAANAYALSPTDSPDIEIFMSGASAQDNNIEALFGQLCVAGTLDIFRDNSANPGSAHRAFFCNINSSQVPGLSLTNPAVLFHKRSAGGSAQGVNPVIDGAPIAAMVINNNNCTQVGVTNEWLCTINIAGDLMQVVSTAGVSDVNPEMFVGVNTPAGFDPVDPVVVANTMDVTGAAALVFGIPVTTGLRDALQEIRINAGQLPAGCIGINNKRCMPSLSRHQIASLFSGQIQNWDQIVTTNHVGTPFTQAVSTVPAPTNNQVAICRRVNGSGTQAQFNAKFLNNPCTASAVPPASVSNPVNGPIVILNSGAGDVDLCLNDFNNGTNLTGANPSSAKFWAIGVQSTEKNANIANDYRFIRIDGIPPTIKTAARGTYLDWVELTYQWKKPGQPNAPSANQLAILEKVASDAGSPSILAAVNESEFFHPWGRAGYLALSTNGHKTTANTFFDKLNPVIPYTHKPAGGSLNNCNVPVIDRDAVDTDDNTKFFF